MSSNFRATLDINYDLSILVQRKQKIINDAVETLKEAISKLKINEQASGPEVINSPSTSLGQPLRQDIIKLSNPH